jgi:hypothetical protein
MCKRADLQTQKLLYVFNEDKSIGDQSVRSLVPMFDEMKDRTDLSLSSSTTTSLKNWIAKLLANF